MTFSSCTWVARSKLYAVVSPERFRQVEELYHSARELEPGERGALRCRDSRCFSRGAREGHRKPIPFLRSEFNELLGQLSPDSHWMAYASDESGRREVYVRPFPAAEGQWKISLAGGDQPRWRGDGKELFFVGADGMMIAVAVRGGSPAGPGMGQEPNPPLKPERPSRCSKRTCAHLPPTTCSNTTSLPTGSASFSLPSSPARRPRHP